MVMLESSVVQARIEPDLKVQGEAILHSVGLSTATAITLFFTQLVNQRSFPIELKAPNAETQAAFAEGREPGNLATYRSVQEVFDENWV